MLRLSAADLYRLHAMVQSQSPPWRLRLRAIRRGVPPWTTVMTSSRSRKVSKLSLYPTFGCGILIWPRIIGSSLCRAYAHTDIYTHIYYIYSGVSSSRLTPCMVSVLKWTPEVKMREHLGERRHRGPKAKVRFEENKSKVRFLEKVSAPLPLPNPRPKYQGYMPIFSRTCGAGDQLGKAG